MSAGASIGALLGAVVVAVFRQAPILVLAAVLLWILGGLGKELGLPLLFWRTTHGHSGEKARARLVVGWAVGVFLGMCCFLAALSEGTDRHLTQGTLIAIVFVLEVLCGVVVLGIAWLRGEGWHFPAAAAAGFCAVYGIVRWGGLAIPDWFRYHPMVRWLLDPPLGPREPLGELEGAHLVAAVLFVIGAVLYLALWAANRFRGWKVYPALAVCVVLTVAAAAECFLAVRMSAGQPAVLALALLAYAALSARYRRATARGLAPGAVQQQMWPIADAEALNAWQHGLPAGRPVLVVVAANGGGIRAGLWAAATLTAIEKQWPAFARHVRLITGASGGMLGATYWAATLDARGQHRENGNVIDGKTLVAGVAAGGLSAVASGLVFRDLLPPPFRVGPDRGTSLEKAWEENCPTLRRSIGELRIGEVEGWRPSVVLAPMVVEDGRRLIISNLDLDALLQNQGPTVGGAERYSFGGHQALKAWPWAQDSLSLSTAVRLQANFPWVLPSTEVPPLAAGHPRLRVVDAGYYDETGVDLACLWIRQHFDFLRQQTEGVLLLQLRDTPSIARNATPTKDRGWLAKGLDGLGTPVSAVLRARDSTTWYRNDATVADLAARFGQAKAEGFFTTAVLELQREASLSWSLTPEEVDAVCSDVGSATNASTIDRIAAWAGAPAR
jgi:hypothetical protein